MKTLISIFNRVRLWGAKGVWDYVLRMLSNWKIRRWFRANARRYPMKPERGITILADMTKRSSLSKAMRDLAFALQRAGIPFQAFDLHPHKEVPDADIGDILTPPDDFRILKYSNVIEMFSSPLPEELPLRRSRIIFWEFTTGLLEYNPSIGDASTIIAMSDFNMEVFRGMFPSRVTVRKILYPFFFERNSIPSSLTIREKYGIPAHAFVVFFNFDYGSSFNRKNPDGSIRAFAKALADKNDAYMVFKTKGASKHLEERNKIVQLSNELGIAKRVVMIDDYIPQNDIYGLSGACDVYLSLHRGEGFGLGIAEAMSLGKPVVVTDYSSTTEFCNAENSIPVQYSIVKVPDNMHDHPCYHSVKEWAEPDIDNAANALLRLYRDAALRSRLGSTAKAFVEDHFSVEHFRKSIETFLCEK